MIKSSQNDSSRVQRREKNLDQQLDSVLNSLELRKDRIREKSKEYNLPTLETTEESLSETSKDSESEVPKKQPLK